MDAAESRERTKVEPELKAVGKKLSKLVLICNAAVVPLGSFTAKFAGANREILTLYSSVMTSLNLLASYVPAWNYARKKAAMTKDKAIISAATTKMDQIMRDILDQFAILADGFTKLADVSNRVDKMGDSAESYKKLAELFKSERADLKRGGDDNSDESIEDIVAIYGTVDDDVEGGDDIVAVEDDIVDAGDDDDESAVPLYPIPYIGDYFMMQPQTPLIDDVPDDCPCRKNEAAMGASLDFVHIGGEDDEQIHIGGVEAAVSIRSNKLKLANLAKDVAKNTFKESTMYAKLREILGVPAGREYSELRRKYAADDVQLLGEMIERYKPYTTMSEVVKMCADKIDKWYEVQLGYVEKQLEERGEKLSPTQRAELLKSIEDEKQGRIDFRLTYWLQYVDREDSRITKEHIEHEARDYIRKDADEFDKERKYLLSNLAKLTSKSADPFKRQRHKMELIALIKKLPASEMNLTSWSMAPIDGGDGGRTFADYKTEVLAYLKKVVEREAALLPKYNDHEKKFNNIARLMNEVYKKIGDVIWKSADIDEAAMLAKTVILSDLIVAESGRRNIKLAHSSDYGMIREKLINMYKLPNKKYITMSSIDDLIAYVISYHNKK